MNISKRFSSNRKKDLVKLETNKKNLIEAKAAIREKRENKSMERTAEKESEEKLLKQKLADQKKILNSIKKDRSKIAKNIEGKRKSEKKIRDLIIKLVEEAELKTKVKEEKQKTEVMITSERKTTTQTSQKEFNVGSQAPQVLLSF
ncbi:MAG: hypothetical protein MZV64_69190 [Ignavibacteriales bacterium]|nr:hypothetical protein [Ignavibacteriales bacterium]